MGAGMVDRLAARMNTKIEDPSSMDAATTRRFNRTHISRRDFSKAISFIDAAMLHELHKPEYEALLLGAIVYYARPFSGNERDNPPLSDTRLVLDVEGLLRDDFELHKRLIEIRNKAVAHSEFAYYPVRLLPTDAGFRGKPRLRIVESKLARTK